MKFNKEQWDEARFESWRESNPELTEEEIKIKMEEQDRDSEWIDFERKFQKKFNSLSRQELAEIFYSSSSPTEFYIKMMED